MQDFQATKTMADDMTGMSVVLMSGGLDSSTAAAFACAKVGKQNVMGLGFNYGQRHAYELVAAAKVAASLGIPHNVIDLSDITQYLKGSALTDNTIQVPDGHYEEKSMAITVVPNRNAIMLSIAFGVARGLGCKYVWIGTHSGDHAIYPDCRPEFIDAFGRMESLANADLPEGGPRLVAPFIFNRKEKIVEWADKLGLDTSLTYSCYKGLPIHCGTCGTCTERKEAFALAHVLDRTQYANPLLLTPSTANVESSRAEGN
jgi:7-cyano-7-deazaguanine synthase